MKYTKEDLPGMIHVVGEDAYYNFGKIIGDKITTFPCTKDGAPLTFGEGEEAISYVLDMLENGTYKPLNSIGYEIY